MKDFLNVDYSDKSESYNVKFKVTNIYVGIYVDGYNLKNVIDKFLDKFKEEYDYWNRIDSEHLNEESLEVKKRFKEFEQVYEKLTE